ncbi:MAG: hypothetical protein WCX71_02825 [Candidatus Buchananbacteria bacterium]
MLKFSKFFFFSLSLLLVFTLTGCGQKSATTSPTSSNGSQNTDENTSKNDGQINVKQSFSALTEVKLPDSPALGIEGEIRPILKKIFGDLKVTGYSSEVYGAGSMLVEYTPSQKPTPAKLPEVTEALKDKGYTTDVEHVDSNIGTAMYEGDKYTITVTINTATPIVGVSYIGK